MLHESCSYDWKKMVKGNGVEWQMEKEILFCKQEKVKGKGLRVTNEKC